MNASQVVPVLAGLRFQAKRLRCNEPIVAGLTRLPLSEVAAICSRRLEQERRDAELRKFELLMEEEI